MRVERISGNRQTDRHTVTRDNYRNLCYAIVKGLIIIIVAELQQIQYWKTLLIYTICIYLCTSFANDTSVYRYIKNATLTSPLVYTTYIHVHAYNIS